MIVGIFFVAIRKNEVNAMRIACFLCLEVLKNSFIAQQ